MELTEIKGSIFGYSKKSVREYISELNVIQDTELAAEKESAAKAAAKFEERIKELDEANKELMGSKEELCAKVSSLEEEIASLKEALAKAEDDNKAVNEKYSDLERETQYLRDRSDVISTAIINAEKCATTMINEADVRAKEMIGEAESKVKVEVKRLDTTKLYIAEVKSAVEAAFRKIEGELSGIETDIIDKKEDIYSDDKKTGVREKFEMFFKKA